MIWLLLGLSLWGILDVVLGIGLFAWGLTSLLGGRDRLPELPEECRKYLRRD